MATYKYITDRNPDGIVVGYNSSDKLCFYGGTPMTRSTLSAAAVATTVAVTSEHSTWGFTSSTQANAIVSLVNELRALIVALGLAA